MDLSNYNWYYREEMLQALGLIQTGYYHQHSSVMDIDSSVSLETMIQSHIKTRINMWIQSPLEDTIWIRGSRHGVWTPTSQNTLEAAYAKVISDKAEIPNVFYFYSLRYPVYHYQPEPSKGEMLLDMVKSIIVQLVMLLSEQPIYTDIDLSTERFLRLTDPGVSISTALSLLRDIRVFGPPYLNCIVEGLEKVESPTDTRHTQNLLRTLLELSKHEPALASNVQFEDYVVAKINRACFTSTGSVGVLDNMVNAGRVEKVVRTPYLSTARAYVLPTTYSLPEDDGFY
ncbi:hypothetical protein F4813DRAFT_387132 [Daldinia decipiens]|uniref:uncharacterized protein n=1 Tax=Daldinia decipiens TaxID=326647 RepID=UPI0020C3F4FD|nr:uncharacterized protein F4813DRAFT_387132 [Daldinia decipiens]KAI1660270.1 hypothetical protein F4813DRAFT_387132 [Daldinia decipiens]